MRFRLSDDGKFAYREGVGIRGFWMSTSTFDVGVVEAECTNSLFSPEGVRLRTPDGTGLYERKVLPFSFWKIDSRQKRTLDLPEDDLFCADYMLHEAWRNAR